MGQVFIPSGSGGFSAIVPIDRLLAKNAGSGQAGDHVFMVGQNAGANTTQSDLYIIGAEALDAGPTALAFNGTVAIGRRALSELLTHTNNVGPAGPGSIVAIGRDAGGLLAVGDSSVLIGERALANYVGLAPNGGDKNVVIGFEALEKLNGTALMTANTVLGWRALQGAVATFACLNNVVIGALAAPIPSSVFQSNVVIGANAGALMGSASASQQNVVIGSGAGGTLNGGDDNTIIGNAAQVTNAAQEENTVIGSGATAYGSQNVVIGKGAQNGSSGAAGDHSIVIGYNAGSALPGGISKILYIGVTDTGVENCAIYGVLPTGNIILGRSIQGVDRDTGGAGAANIVKLLNGVIGAVPPVGGGYFYVAAGALHWVGSAGTDTVLAPA